MTEILSMNTWNRMHEIHFNMDNNSKENTEYQQGFNEGYIIAQYLPDVSSSLSKVENTSPRIEGFHDGQEQYQLELIQQLRLDKENEERQRSFEDPER